MDKGIHTYRNGNYKVLMFPDGTKIRNTSENEFIPKFAENCDVKITDRCDGGCPFCYEGCTVNGKHADLLNLENFINSLHPYTEMALNGNDLSHPQLTHLLYILKTKNVYANLTVNQRHFMKYKTTLKEWTDRYLIHGLGISLVDPTEEFISEVKQFPDAVIHTINGVLTVDQINSLKGHGLKILILGYKNLNRGIDYLETCGEIVKKNQKDLYDILPQITEDDSFRVISFDNLAIEQLNVERVVPKEDWDEFYMGDDGKFTFYIDLVKREFAKNSISQERYPMGDLTIDQMFEIIRSNNNVL